MRNKNNKNRMKDDDSSSGGGWEIVYTGFVLILLCFFIMLNSFSSMEETKILKFVKSFTNAVSILSGGLGLESGEEVLIHSKDIVDNESDIAAILEDFSEFIKSHGLEKEVTVSISDKGIVMRLSDKALFGVGVAEISTDAVLLLDKIGSVISKTTHSIIIQGHTDDLPIQTKKFPSNWELSTARAVNVLRYIAEKYEIPMQRLSAVGFGEFQPVCKNDTAQHRAKNRRVEIVFVSE